MSDIVRVCPSPTGKLHLGTIRTIYFNWLISKQHKNSRLILRIDDTDLTRTNNDLIKPIFVKLKELGLDYDITFKQSDHFDIYKTQAIDLVKRGLAKYEGKAIRLNGLSDNINCDWIDTITGGKKASDSLINLSKHQVLIKSDGSPTYNFASVIDDSMCGVTWIVRGVDHIPNTYKQVFLFRLLGTPLPKFTHVGLVCHSSGKKLSKRDSDEIDLTNISSEALLNYILRLGWSPKEDTKKNNIINREKAIKLFLSEGKMKASNAKIDLVKLNWYNKKYK